MSGMEVLIWVGKNWFDLVQTLGILVGFFFTAHTIRKDERARQIANTIAIASAHREIWKELNLHPGLKRVLAPKPDLEVNPISEREEVFVNALILHLSTAFRAAKYDELVKMEG